MGDSPVVPYTGFDAAMAHDKRMLAEMKAQADAGVPLGEIRASGELKMPGHYAVVNDIGDRPKPAADFNEETLRNLEKVYEDLDTTPPAAATVVNLHPITLRVNGGRHFMYSVPPCTPSMSLNEPGKQCTHLPLYDSCIDPVPQDSGNHTFDKVPPIWIAQQYMNVANGNAELWGPGAFIYEGDLTPSEMWEQNPLIKVFTDQGIPLFTETGGMVPSRRRGGIVQGKQRVAVTRSYREVYMEMWERRNKAYFEIVTRMDSEYHQTEGGRRKFVGINGMTRDQAQICVNLGLLLKAPEWLTATRIDAGVSPDKCSNCGSDVLSKAVMCQHCNWPVDPYQAFINKAIGVEHAALDDLSPEKLADVYRIDKERKSNRAKAREMAEAAPDVRSPELGAGNPAPSNAAGGAEAKSFGDRMKESRERKRKEAEEKAEAKKTGEPQS